MKRLDALVELSYEDLVAKARVLAASHRPAHLHTTVPFCAITGRSRPAIVIEATDEGTVYVFFDATPIEERAKPLAISCTAPRPSRARTTRSNPRRKR